MSGFGIQKKGTSPILKQAGSPGPTVPILPEDFAQGPKLPDDIAAKQRSGFKKGGKAMDESMAHEGMESMKMEIDVVAPRGGVIKSINVATNDTVVEGQIVAVLG